MYVHTELEPYLIFLNIFLTLCWSLSTWLTMQNKKLHSELIPQNQFISKKINIVFQKIPLEIPITIENFVFGPFASYESAQRQAKKLQEKG